VVKTKSPLSVDRVSGPELLKCCLGLSLQSQVHRRRNAMRVMVVAMMEMRLHAERIRAMGEVVNIFRLESLAIFCVEGIGILDGADLVRICAAVCGYFR